MHFDELRNKQVAVWGFGREGKTFVQLWKKCCPNKPLAVIDENPQNDVANFNTQNLQLFKDAKSAINNFEVIVKSPGISCYRPEITTAKDTKFTSLVDLWLSENTNTPVIAVTGSKGKSTTASLIYHLLKSQGVKVFLAGNVGIPLFEQEVQPNSTWVLELSSYQAHDVKTPIQLAVLTNLYPEHCDWHGSVEQYYQDKLNIFKQQNRSNFGIINGQDPNTNRYLQEIKCPIFYNTPTTIHYQDGYFYQGKKQLFPRNVSPLLGTHNAINICAALTALSAYGTKPINCAESLKSFSGLPHRLQYVATINDVVYIDDSISTIPQAALAALAAFPSRKITLLLGGQQRAQEWDKFAKEISNNPPYAIITMPDNGADILKALKEVNPQGTLLFETSNLEQAVAKAKEITPKSGVVILSPAAPSYGKFKNFEERGEAFKNYVTQSSVKNLFLNYL